MEDASRVFVPVIVTLIHGTFDAKARWTEADSVICKKITQMLDSKVVISTFQWSGNNTENDRRAAAVGLANHIATFSSRLPYSPHFLIGHSHGGNILRWALGLASPTASKTVAGAITVSTPFIEITRRDFIDGILMLVLAWRSILIFALGLGWLTFFAANNDIILRSFFLVKLQVPGVMLLIFIPLLALYIFVRFVSNHYARRFLTFLVFHQQHTIDRSMFSTECPQPFFCIYTKRDEVNFIFGGARGIVGISRVLEPIFALARRLYRSHLAEFLSPCRNAALGMIGVAAVLVVVGNMAGHDVSRSLLFDYGIPLAVFALITSIATPIAMAVGIWLYGTTTALDLLVVNFRTSMRPVGVPNITVSTVSPLFAQVKGVNRNVHTGILYGDEVASKIATFLKDTLTRRPM